MSNVVHLRQAKAHRVVRDAVTARVNDLCFAMRNLVRTEGGLASYVKLLADKTGAPEDEIREMLRAIATLGF